MAEAVNPWEKYSSATQAPPWEAYAPGVGGTASNSQGDQTTSLAAQVGRQVELTGRYAVEGGMALPDMIGNALGLHSSEAVSGLLDRLGFPKPQGALENDVGDVARQMAGVMPIVKAGELLSKLEYAPEIIKHLGSLLESSPASQTAAAATGAAASDVAKRAGAGPAGQFAAGMVGSSVPGYFVPNLPGLVRRGLGGVSDEESAAMATAARKRFNEAGVQPSASQVFKTGQLRAAEAALAYNPSSHETMRAFAVRQAKQLSNAVQRAASVLSERSSPMMAGRAIEDGITEPGGFMDRFRQTSNALYGALDGFIPGNTIAKTDHTMSALDKLTAPTPGAEATSKILSNARVFEVRQALASDTGGTPPTKVIEILGADGKPISSVEIGGKPGTGGIPYSALKELRTKVGGLIADTGITSDIPRRQLKVLYGAITDDMRSAVEQTGSKQAMSIFDRANSYVRAGHNRIDSILQPVLNRNLPERVYEAATSGTKKGDSTIHAVMQSLPPKEQSMVAGTVLRRLGVANASDQSAEGDVFSVSKFLTNWSAMSDEAKRSLFSRYGSKYVENLDRLAKIAQDIRESGKIYANPSGTAPALILQGTVFGAIFSMFSGNFTGAAIAGATQAAGYFAARKITDPKFVAWLSKYAYANVSMLPAALNDLAQSYSSSARNR